MNETEIEHIARLVCGIYAFEPDWNAAVRMPLGVSTMGDSGPSPCRFSSKQTGAHWNAGAP